MDGVDYSPTELNGYYYGEFEYGSQLQLTAVPAQGYRFVSWSNTSTNPVLNITNIFQISSINQSNFHSSNYTYVHRPSDITANFEAIPTTGIENNAVSSRSVKRVVNGQLLIFKNGKTYNVLGEEVKH